ncbi:MAG: PEP-CTERM-box response regulator transcription factor [Gammaproteobacteria bacterium]|nr:PEP-CTERM-box response regulator transcription factor [Gammaproteobacteria bacterium]MDH3767246.1 PEP-CTERM-box response regulator transcription factor [Gammaproteobacteria bacterium]
MSEDKKALLIVEDDTGLQSQLKWCFEGYNVLIAEDRESAIAELRRNEPKVVLQDLGLPPDPEGVSEGMATLQQMLSITPDIKVIVVTGNADTDNAVRAVGHGAYDFYQKPLDTEVLQLIVQRAFSMWELEEENRLLLARNASSPLEGFIATSDKVIQVCRLIEKVAPTTATTLLLGESGTGKELLARALHNLSPRASEAFVAINCAAIPENLLESELFGYEKGSFTGAAKTTPGKIEFANDGTLFLDEIGDMPLALQAKLLRFLQERTVERVGGRKEIPVDVRVVCATNQDLKVAIADNRFREDLYYRISEVTAAIPPLRDRPGDAVVMARAFLQENAAKQSSPLRNFTQGALQAIETHEWPGNVRELENKVKSAVIMAEGKQVTAADLGLDVAGTGSYPMNLRAVRLEAERRALTQVLTITDGNISKAAELLGITRPTFYNLMQKHDITETA